MPTSIGAPFSSSVSSRAVSGAAFFRDEVLPNLPNVLDFRRFSYESLFAESDRVVALVNFGLTGNDAMIKISEHWTVKDGKAASIWVAYFEPQALLEKLGIAHGLGGWSS